MAKKGEIGPGRMGKERAKKPIIRENTAGCHLQDSPDETIGRRFAVILFSSVVAPFKREAALPFRDFMTNLFNDRPGGELWPHGGS